MIWPESLSTARGPASLWLLEHRRAGVRSWQSEMYWAKYTKAKLHYDFLYIRAAADILCHVNQPLRFAPQFVITVQDDVHCWRLLLVLWWILLSPTHRPSPFFRLSLAFQVLWRPISIFVAQFLFSLFKGKMILITVQKRMFLYVFSQYLASTNGVLGPVLSTSLMCSPVC